MQDFGGIYIEFHDLIRGMQVGDIDVISHCIPPLAKKEWKFAMCFEHLTRNAMMYRCISRWSEIIKISARTALANEVETIHSRWLQKQTADVLGVRPFAERAESEGPATEKDYFDRFCRLQQSGLVVVEDGFDPGNALAILE